MVRPSSFPPHVTKETPNYLYHKYEISSNTETNDSPVSPNTEDISLYSVKDNNWNRTKMMTGVNMEPFPVYGIEVRNVCFSWKIKDLEFVSWSFEMFWASGIILMTFWRLWIGCSDTNFETAKQQAILKPFYCVNHQFSTYAESQLFFSVNKTRIWNVMYDMFQIISAVFSTWFDFVN